MIQQQIVQHVLEEALQTGGDFSELFLEDTESTGIVMTDGKVEDATYSRIHGAGVRVLRGVQSVYAYTCDTSEKGLLETARKAAEALRFAGAGSADRPAGAVRQRGAVCFDAGGGKVYGRAPQQPAGTVGNEAKVALLRRAHAAAKASSGEIAQVVARYMDTDQRVLVANSEGVFAQDRRPRVRAYIQAVAQHGSDMQTGTCGPGCGMGFEAFATRIDVEAAAREAAETAATVLHAPECPAGVFPVVIDGGFGGVIFHEACGHSLEATAVSKGNSEFCGKLGQKIASDRVSATDDGTLDGEWGTLGCDDEGTPTQRNVLIEKGILKGYLIDRLGARRMGMPVTGSSRRQNYTFAPTSRMNNTFIEPGTDDEEEMIASVATGVYAKKMGGGSVNPLTGEFNFAVDEGYWIKNGKIHCPVRGATLIGRGSEVLMKIDRVGPKMWMAQGVCGSVSGHVPTNVGQPRIRVSSLTVGGKGGAL